jgi:hypothetical protein
MPDAGKIRARADAARVQRERQQGLGKPIISASFNGGRLVVVKNRRLHSTGWLTFQDFLLSYIMIAIGPDWGTAELAKPIEERHPILVWYHKLCEHQRTFVKVPGKVHGADMTGAAAAYMHLAYDLVNLRTSFRLRLALILRNNERTASSPAAARSESSFDPLKCLPRGSAVPLDNWNPAATTQAHASERCLGSIDSVTVPSGVDPFPQCREARDKRHAHQGKGGWLRRCGPGEDPRSRRQVDSSRR